MNSGRRLRIKSAMTRGSAVSHGPSVSADQVRIGSPLNSAQLDQPMRTRSTPRRALRSARAPNRMEARASSHRVLVLESRDDAVVIAVHFLEAVGRDRE